MLTQKFITLYSEVTFNGHYGMVWCALVNEDVGIPAEVFALF